MAYPLQRNQQSTLTREDGLAYTWDANTGQYVNTKGLTYEQQNPRPPDQLGLPPVPTVPAPDLPPPVPDPAQGQGNNVPPPSVGWGQSPARQQYGWGTGFTGSQAGTTSPFANLTGVQQAYYQLHPDQANQLLRQWLAPNPTSPLAQYIGQREPDTLRQWGIESTKPENAGLQYTDFLKQRFGQYTDQYANQSQTQRGENPLSFNGGFAGRKTFA